MNKCVSEYLNKGAGNEKNPESDPESEEEVQEIEPEEITSHDALIFIDKLINLKEFNDTERSTLSSLEDRLEVVRINNKKQLSIFLSNQSNDLLRLITFSFYFPMSILFMLVFFTFLFSNDSQKVVCCVK